MLFLKIIGIILVPLLVFYLIGKLLQKLEKSDNTGCLMLVIGILLLCLIIGGAINGCNSCSDSSYGYDYYDGVRK